MCVRVCVCVSHMFLLKMTGIWGKLLQFSFSITFIWYCFFALHISLKRKNTSCKWSSQKNSISAYLRYFMLFLFFVRYTNCCYLDMQNGKREKRQQYFEEKVLNAIFGMILLHHCKHYTNYKYWNRIFFERNKMRRID